MSADADRMCATAVAASAKRPFCSHFDSCPRPLDGRCRAIRLRNLQMDPVPRGVAFWHADPDAQPMRRPRLRATRAPAVQAAAQKRNTWPSGSRIENSRTPQGCEVGGSSTVTPRAR